MVNQPRITGRLQVRQCQQALLEGGQWGQMADDLGRQFDHGQRQVTERFQHPLRRGPTGATGGLTRIQSPQRLLLRSLSQLAADAILQQAQHAHGEARGVS